MNVVCRSHIVLDLECDSDEEFSLWATTRSRSLFRILKRLMGLWEPGSESGLPGFRMWITSADFQAEGKYPNLRIQLKSWVRWMRAVWEKF